MLETDTLIHLFTSKLVKQLCSPGAAALEFSFVYIIHLAWGLAGKKRLCHLRPPIGSSLLWPQGPAPEQIRSGPSLLEVAASPSPSWHWFEPKAPVHCLTVLIPGGHSLDACEGHLERFDVPSDAQATPQIGGVTSRGRTEASVCCQGQQWISL